MSAEAEPEEEGHADAEVLRADAADGSDEEDPDGSASDADAAGDAQLQEAIRRIRADRGLAPPPLPAPPSLALHAKPADKLRAVQAYIERLQYNYTGTDYFDIRKNRPYARVLETARQIVRTALPIKCVEAVFVGLLLTQELAELERVPLAFKSRVDGRVAKHIVLAVRHPSVGWGALGLSRRPELYFKELGSAGCLAQLYASFLAGYEAVGHRLVRVRVGLPVPHDSFSTERVCWAYRALAVRKGRKAHAELCAQLNAFARSAPKLAHAWRTGGAHGPSPAAAGASAAPVPADGPAASAVPAERHGSGGAAAGRQAKPPEPARAPAPQASPKRAVAASPKRALAPCASAACPPQALRCAAPPRGGALPKAPSVAAPHLRV